MTVEHPLSKGQKVLVKGKATVCYECGVQPDDDVVETVVTSVSKTNHGYWYRVEAALRLVAEDMIVGVVGKDEPAPQPAPVVVEPEPAPVVEDMSDLDGEGGISV